MNVLLIAPQPAHGHIPSEVQEAVNALKPRLLQGPITQEILMRELRQPYDLVWFAAHMGPDGIALFDGPLPADRLMQLMRSPRPRAIYLNTCDSADMALAIHDALGICVICTVSQIPDDTAYITGAQFAHYLSRNPNIRTAYELSRPGAGKEYRMIGGTDGEDRIDGIIHLITHIHADLREEIQGVEERFNKRIDDIEQDLIQSINKIQANYQFRLGKRNTSFWALGFMIFCCVMALGYVDVRDALDISWQASLVFSIPLLAISAALIGLGLGMNWS